MQPRSDFQQMKASARCIKDMADVLEVNLPEEPFMVWLCSSSPSFAFIILTTLSLSISDLDSVFNGAKDNRQKAPILSDSRVLDCRFRLHIVISFQYGCKIRRSADTHHTRTTANDLTISVRKRIQRSGRWRHSWRPSRSSPCFLEGFSHPLVSDVITTATIRGQLAD